MKSAIIRIATIAVTACLAITLFGCGNSAQSTQTKLSQEVNYGQASLHIPDDAKTYEGTTSGSGLSVAKSIKTVECDDGTRATIYVSTDDLSDLYSADEEASKEQALEIIASDATWGTPSVESNEHLKKIIVPMSGFSISNDGEAITAKGYRIILCQFNQSYIVDIYASSDSYENAKATVEAIKDNASTDTSLETLSLKTMESIKATYSGSTKEGATIDSDSDIDVTGIYDDGSTEEIDSWEIESPKTLKAGKTVKVKITYNGLSTTLTVKCTSKTKAQKKAEYKQKCKSVGYKSVARNPEKYEGDKIKISGKVLQVSEGDYGINTLRVATSGGYENVYLVSYDSSDLSQNIIEDDQVTIWGECTGTTSYTTVMGASLTIPSMDAKYFSIS
ncbi:MAG: hypothetical protein Q4A43_00710 [Coriobacteriia bacterium]|nr:hypothetical protein [Coriobacteriia bacterium]